MSVEYELMVPVEQGEQVYEKLSFREPTGKELRSIGLPITAAKEIKMEQVCQYISALAAVPPSVVDKMAAKDIVQMLPIIIGFFGDGADLM